MKNRLPLLLFCVSLSFGNCLQAQKMESFEVTDAWKSQIEKLAPAKTTFPTKKKNKILLFSLFTGFNHWVVPHTAAVVETLGQKSGAFEIVSSNDIAMFEKNNLKQFDAVVLNNNCSINPRRDLFYDKVREDKSMPEDNVIAKAKEMEDNLLNFVKKGGGLMALHGGIVMQNKSPEFSEMMGGSFNYHPTQQPLSVRLADPTNPLVEAFDGKGFTHVDEPYMFNVAYAKQNFRPLLYINTSEIQGLKGDNPENKKYISWIKRYGKGRVMYASPSHNAQSYTEHPALLKFLLDGMQYVVGDVKVDDSPIGTSGQ